MRSPKQTFQLAKYQNPKSPWRPLDEGKGYVGWALHDGSACSRTMVMGTIRVVEMELSEDEEGEGEDVETEEYLDIRIRFEKVGPRRRPPLPPSSHRSAAC